MNSSTTHSPTLTRATESSDQGPAITREEAGAIATLLRLIRPSWDQLATLNAVADASRTRRELAELTAGCIRIAQDRDNRTPNALRYAEAWRRAAIARRVPSVRANASCTVPGHEGYPADNCGGCIIDRKLELAAASRDQFNHPPARYGEDR